jgi:hypothetical protein
MARSSKVTVPEIIESAADSPAAALAALRKHLKSGIGERYESRTNYLGVILDRVTKNVEIIARARDSQWRVIHGAILLLVAVTAAVQLMHALVPGIMYRAVVGAAAAVGIALIYATGRNMMEKINGDIAFYREHGKLNEEMLNMTVGIPTLANKVITSRNEALSSRHDTSFSAEESRLTFTRWMNRTMAGAAVAALAAPARPFFSFSSAAACPTARVRRPRTRDFPSPSATIEASRIWPPPAGTTASIRKSPRRISPANPPGRQTCRLPWSVFATVPRFPGLSPRNRKRVSGRPPYGSCCRSPKRIPRC